jgi:membrane-bound lytic murein transglycosylase F
MTSAHEFEQIKRTYTSCKYDPIKRADKGIVSKTLSPYDDVIRKYAAELGWDWRMLAAVVYQESKFSINSRSHRGAQGLMQVMPQTAKHYQVEDLLDPDQNLKAGTSHLKRLQRLYIKQDLEPMELIKFTLAAYNAGEGRVADCRSFAAKQQVDSTKWDEIVKIIPLMREDSILEDESVKLGKFQGHETIAYIDNVMALYDAFCRICPNV